MKKKILFAGESCFVQTTEFKGYDLFTGIRYNEHAGEIEALLDPQRFSFHHIPCHRIPARFPRTLEELREYDAVILSDVGADTFLLIPEMVRTGVRVPNLLKLIREYVAGGGGFAMIGGYMSFQGINARARFHGTAIEELLPVTILPGDDRQEVPEGANLTCVPGSHPILEGLPAQWPYVLGYNKLTAKEGSQVLVSFEGDPLITAWTYGQGRAVAYAMDCAAHWAPAAMTQWDGYSLLWNNIAAWITGLC